MKKFLDIQIEDRFKVKSNLLVMGIIAIEYYGKIEVDNYLI